MNGFGVRDQGRRIPAGEMGWLVGFEVDGDGDGCPGRVLGGGRAKAQ